MANQLMRVLVVDDNHDNADIIRNYLESTRDYTVTAAYDGDEALRSFQELRPHLVLLDVMMPGINGWEVCRVIKSDPARAATTRVIMLTARDDLIDKRTALQTGADDFLEKPLDLSKVLAAVRRNAAVLTGTQDRANPGSKAAPGRPASPATHG